METGKEVFGSLKDLSALDPKEKRELLNSNIIEDLLSVFFGDKLSKQFIKGMGYITSVIFRNLGLGGEKLEQEAMFNELDKNREKIKKCFIAHRANEGTSEKQTAETTIKRLGQGRSVEVDVRLDEQGDLRISHDPLPLDKLESDGVSKLTEVVNYMVETPKAGPLLIDLKGSAKTAEVAAELIKKTDKQNEGKANYIPLKGRVAFASFNPSSLTTVKEIDPEYETVFHYYPSGSFPWLEERFGPAIEKGAITSELLSKIARNYGGDDVPEEILKALEETKLISGTLNPYKYGDHQHVACLYNILPPAEVLKNSNNISVHYLLVRNLPELFEQFKQEYPGKKIIVHGFPAQSDADGRNLMEYEQQRIIAMGADLIVTDGPALV